VAVFLGAALLCLQFAHLVLRMLVSNLELTMMLYSGFHTGTSIFFQLVMQRREDFTSQLWTRTASF